LGEAPREGEGSGPTGSILEFRDGKIVRWEDFGTKEKALKAVGLER
jgi:hypothetical protein